MALTGLIFGYLGLACIPILIIAAIAIPNLLRARIAANETSPVHTIRTINTAELAYANQHPNAGYTGSLSELASVGLPGEVAKGERNGYVFQL